MDDSAAVFSWNVDINTWRNTAPLGPRHEAPPVMPIDKKDLTFELSIWVKALSHVFVD